MKAFLTMGYSSYKLSAWTLYNRVIMQKFFIIRSHNLCPILSCHTGMVPHFSFLMYICMSHPKVSQHARLLKHLKLHLILPLYFVLWCEMKFGDTHWIKIVLTHTSIIMKDWNAEAVTQTHIDGNEIIWNLWDPSNIYIY